MEETARVTRILEDGRAELTVLRSAACSGECGQCGGCSAARTVTVCARNPIGARVNDIVLVQTESRQVLLAAGIVYLLPILLFFAGYALGAGLGFAGAGGMTGFLLGVGAAVWWNRMVQKRRGMQAVICAFAQSAQE